ncbi:MAG: nucleotide exchange factor GrpE [Nitrososphaerota archaeon]|nr:nucleotide exchange factor GrpE [Nitrososphaerota archaeon]
MQEEPSRTGDVDEVASLKAELARKSEELLDIKARLESVSRSDLEADLDKAQKLIDQERTRGEDYLAQLKYLQADFENYRKRVDREIRDIEDFSTSSLIRRLLPVLDDLELALSTGEKAGVSGMLEGISMVQKNLVSALQSEGLKPIEAVGRPFDPTLHEAVERVDGEANQQDMVVGEIRKGYTLKDKVLRPSMVRVETAVKTNSENNEHTS